MNLIEWVLDEILSLPVQLVVLGTGEQKYENLFKDKAIKYPKQISACIRFDESLAQRIYAGSDLFLMPSLFEPCGLSQLIAMGYGSLPIVRETGGLNDTVKSFNEYTSQSTGFSFTNYNAHDMLHTIKRAIGFYSDKDLWSKIVQNAMIADYSWASSAQVYQELYTKLKEQIYG